MKKSPGVAHLKKYFKRLIVNTIADDWFQTLDLW